MKLLLDQDVYEITARFLRRLGHDIVQVGEIGLARADDEDLLTEAQKRSRIFVTRDRDFGNLVFVKAISVGVIYLRIPPTKIKSGHQELQRVLEAYDEEELSQVFVVVEPARHRVRKLPPQESSFIHE